MIRWRAICFVLGQTLLALGVAMLFPVMWSLVSGAGGIAPVAWSALATAGVGGAILTIVRRPEKDLGQREALLFVVAAWFAIAAFGAIPFALSGAFPTLTDAFFESASGFTTTGATVLPQVEVLSESVQLWRHFTHWIGGMGIVLLGLAILPVVGHGGMALYRAEFSGAKSEKLKPRIAETAVALWKVYLALTLAEVLALRLAGMTLFEAVCHSFSTLGTGGFSTRTASVGGFSSPVIEWIITVFMLLAGLSFVQHYHLLVEGRVKGFLADFEVRAYVLVFGAACALVALTLAFEGYTPGRAIRAAAFQVASIQTTTGFVSEDFEQWFPLAQAILLGLMLVGGCTGSTAGGLKVARVVLLARVVGREFRRMVERHGVFAVRLGGRVTPEETIQSLLSLVYLSLLVLTVSGLALTAMGLDLLTAFTAVIACMFNIGPGFGTVGAAENYAHLPGLAKWILSVCMIAGRLEFYTLLILLAPDFWRK